MILREKQGAVLHIRREPISDDFVFNSCRLVSKENFTERKHIAGNIIRNAREKHEDENMGVDASILLYPITGDPEHFTPTNLCRQILETLQQSEIVVSGEPSQMLIENNVAGYTRARWEVPLDGASYSILPEHLNRKAESLFLLLTNRKLHELCEEEVPEGEDPDELVGPSISVTAVNKSMPVRNSYTNDTLCKTWALIEINHDLRYDKNIHRLLNERHKVFAALAKLFGSEIAWTVYYF
jgi:hypothetical protein